MIGKSPNDPNDLLLTASEGARHTHVGDAPVQANFAIEDQIEFRRMFNAILAGADAVIIVKTPGGLLRFMFSRCGIAGGLSMLRDVLRAKDGS